MASVTLFDNAHGRCQKRQCFRQEVLTLGMDGLELAPNPLFLIKEGVVKVENHCRYIIKMFILQPCFFENSNHCPRGLLFVGSTQEVYAKYLD